MDIHKIWTTSLMIATILTIGLDCKTLRYKIVTDDDGRREIVPSQGSFNASSDIINFLEKDLNLTQVASTSIPVKAIIADAEVNSNRVTSLPPKSYTAAGNSHELKMWTPKQGWKSAVVRNNTDTPDSVANDPMDVIYKINPTTKRYIEKHYEITKSTEATKRPSDLEDDEAIITRPQASDSSSLSTTPMPNDWIAYKINPTTKSYIENLYQHKEVPDVSLSSPISDVSMDDRIDDVYKLNPTTKSYIDKRFYTTLDSADAATTSPEEVTKMEESDIVHKMNPTTKSYLDKHHQMMKKWNAFTEEGWTRQKNTIYANSTKLIIYDDGSRNQSYPLIHYKQGRAENITSYANHPNALENKMDTVDANNFSIHEASNSKNEKLINVSTEPVTLEKFDEIPISNLTIWDVFARLYDCFGEKTRQNGTISCLQARVADMVLTFLGGSLKSEDRSSQEKTLLHGKKILKGALLPLLVLLIIKYLIALPVLAAGIVTIKTFWLSLLSAGVASFGAPWKKHVLKRHEPEVTWASSSAPWLGYENYAKGQEKYFM